MAKERASKLSASYSKDHQKQFARCISPAQRDPKLKYRANFGSVFRASKILQMVRRNGRKFRRLVEKNLCKKYPMFPFPPTASGTSAALKQRNISGVVMAFLVPGNGWLNLPFSAAARFSERPDVTRFMRLLTLMNGRLPGSASRSDRPPMCRPTSAHRSERGLKGGHATPELQARQDSSDVYGR